MATSITRISDACRAGILVAMLLAAFGSSASADTSVKVSLDPPTVYVGQSSILTVEVVSDSQPIPTPDIPDIEGVPIIQRPGTSHSTRIIQGQITISQAFSYYLRPSKPGKYDIQHITVKKGGKTYVGNAVTLNVLQPGDQLPETPKYFLRAEVNKPTVFVNEPIVLTFRQFSKYRPTGRINLKLNAGAFKGFWHEEVPKQRLEMRTEQYQGSNYYVVDLQQVILFPLSPGEVTIPSVNLETVLESPRRRRDSFFGDFFRDDRVRVEMSSNPVRVLILELPEEGRPEHFNGAVGQYNLRAKVDKTELTAGDLLTLTVTIEGMGNLKNLPEPELPELEGFDRYESTRNENITVTDANVQGSVNFEYLLVPRNADVKQIEPIRFSFFHTAFKDYRTLKTEPISLDIRPSDRPEEETIVIGGGGRQRQINVIGEDLRYIKTDLGEVGNNRSVITRPTVFFAAHGVPILLLILLYAYERRRRYLERNPSEAAARRAPRQARRNLLLCKKIIEQGDSQNFYATLHKTVIHYLDNRLGIPIRGLDDERRHAVLEERLNDKEKIALIEQVLSACNEARFAPGSSEKARMEELFEQAQGIVGRL